ncbi:hypothetical protein E5676_scaffold152G00590 [Cucumis melo var. makuwa]|uniref:Uncharacterized protein n=1 Tax=Cucumis melo var. makuwa TaxID=1194695 RepID=A0A5D3CNL4_CUCMM|nr:hypothetical protein E5676_scaffold152G00590 [Cucumis melo var. makuwa]
MSVARSFDLWQKDAFFSAAEEHKMLEGRMVKQLDMLQTSSRHFVNVFHRSTVGGEFKSRFVVCPFLSRVNVAMTEFEFVYSSEVEIWEMMMESVKDPLFSEGKTVYFGRLTSLAFCGLFGCKGIGVHSGPRG